MGNVIVAMPKYEDANKILDRIKSKFIPNVADSDVVLSYKIRPLKNIKD